MQARVKHQLPSSLYCMILIVGDGDRRCVRESKFVTKNLNFCPVPGPGARGLSPKSIKNYFVRGPEAREPRTVFHQKNLGRFFPLSEKAVGLALSINWTTREGTTQLLYLASMSDSDDDVVS